MNFKRLLIVMMAFCFATFANAQDKTLAGKVTDSKDGANLQSATISVKGTKIITQSSADGSFKIKVPASAKTLTVSSVGFTSQDVAIGDGDLVISLVQANAILNEVVVIGYGTARKKDLSGSVTTVSSKDFARN